MPHPRFPSGEISRRGKEIYDTTLKAKVETQENIGKLISIDIETGDYEIGDDPIATADRLFARHPGAALYGARISHEAIYHLGGSSIYFKPEDMALLRRISHRDEQ